MEREQNLAAPSAHHNSQVEVFEFDFIPDLPEENESSDFDDYREMMSEVSR